MTQPLIGTYPGSDPGRDLIQSAMNIVTTAGAVTLSVSQFVNGIYRRDPNGSGRTDVTPTAVAVLNTLPIAAVGSVFTFFVRNDADAAETITISGGTGVTLVGTATVAQNTTCLFFGVVTGIGPNAAISLVRGPNGIV